MTFDENLPEQCPPAECDCAELEKVYRMLKGSTPSDADWLSYLQEGKPCPARLDPCRWGSLSLQTCFPAIQKLAKLPNFRNATHAAILTLPATAGVHKTQGNHVDFWRDTAANLNDFVTAVKAVHNG